MKLNQEYMQMILEQTAQFGNADFRDAVAVMCGF